MLVLLVLLDGWHRLLLWRLLLLWRILQWWQANIVHTELLLLRRWIIDSVFRIFCSPSSGTNHSICGLTYPRLVQIASTFSGLLHVHFRGKQSKCGGWSLLLKGKDEIIRVNKENALVKILICILQDGRKCLTKIQACPTTCKSQMGPHVGSAVDVATLASNGSAVMLCWQPSANKREVSQLLLNIEHLEE